MELKVHEGLLDTRGKLCLKSDEADKTVGWASIARPELNPEWTEIPKPSAS